MQFSALNPIDVGLPNHVQNRLLEPSVCKQGLQVNKTFVGGHWLTRPVILQSLSSGRKSFENEAGGVFREVAQHPAVFVEVTKFPGADLNNAQMLSSASGYTDW